MESLREPEFSAYVCVCVFQAEEERVSQVYKEQPAALVSNLRLGVGPTSLQRDDVYEPRCCGSYCPFILHPQR